MQPQGAKDLERLVVGALSDRGLLFEAARSFAGPRRLTLAISGLPAKQPDVSEEKKGPRVGAPEKAIEGFLKSAGVTLEECEKRADPKGDFYVAKIARKGRATEEVLAEILPEAIGKLPWPKSMRWGAPNAPSCPSAPSIPPSWTCRRRCSRPRCARIRNISPCAIPNRASSRTVSSSLTAWWRRRAERGLSPAKLARAHV